MAPLEGNQQFHYNVMDKKSDSLKLLATDHSQSFLHTELMVSTCCYCYRLLICTHPLACDQEVISLAANLFNCNHTGDDVVTSFISLCLHHSVHEVFNGEKAIIG